MHRKSESRTEHLDKPVSQKLEIGPQVDSRIISNIEVAFSSAVYGKGRFRPNGGVTIFTTPLFFDYSSNENLPKAFSEGDSIQAQYLHEPVRSYVEGDRTLEGSTWTLVEKTLGNRVKNKKITFVAMGDLPPEHVDKLANIDTEPNLKLYLDGVENYCRHNVAKAKMGTLKYYDGLRSIRKLAHFISEEVGPTNKPWRTFTLNEIAGDKTLPDWVEGGAYLGALYGADATSLRSKLEWDLRFGDRGKPNEEPFTLYQSLFMGTIITLVTDGVSPTVAEKGFAQACDSLQSVLSRLPYEYAPKDIGVIYTDFILGNRHGLASDNLAVFHDVPGVGEEEKRLIREHEMVHAVMFSKYGTCKSSWLTEGTAMLFGDNEGDTKTFDIPSDTSKQIREGIDKIDSFDNDDGPFEYVCGQLLVAFLEEHYGRAFALSIYERACADDLVADSTSDKAVLQEVITSMLPISMEDFTANFKEYVKSKVS